MGRNQRDESLVISYSGGENVQVGAEHFSPNGSGTVTISNVAPAGIGTATISKWLIVRDRSNNVAYYIPCWT